MLLAAKELCDGTIGSGGVSVFSLVFALPLRDFFVLVPSGGIVGGVRGSVWAEVAGVVFEISVRGGCVESSN